MTSASDHARKEEGEAARDERIAAGVLVVREGPAANCSSIGSVVDTLFVTAVAGSALFAVIAAALAKEDVVVVGESSRNTEKKAENERDDMREDDDAPSS